MSEARPEALHFDLGNVLIEVDFARVVRRWAALAGVSPESIATRFEHGPAYEQHERGEIGAAQYYQSLRESLGIGLDDAAFEDGWNQVFGGEIAATVKLAADIAPHIPVYAFSNTNLTHQRHWSVHYAEALRPFRRVFVSNEMGLRKPEAASFEFISREIGVPLERILFFDDTLVNVEGARAVGMPAVLVRGPDDVREAVARSTGLGPPRP